MKTTLALCSVILATSLLTAGCSMSNDQAMGTVAGGALGGVAGHALTGGSTAGTVAGAVGGAIVGHQLTK